MNRHGYRFVVDETDYASPERSRHWNKLKSVESVISELNTRPASVLWLDADAIFSNFQFKIESLVDQARESAADLVICRELSLPKVESNHFHRFRPLIRCVIGAKYMWAHLPQHRLIPSPKHTLVTCPWKKYSMFLGHVRRCLGPKIPFSHPRCAAQPRVSNSSATEHSIASHSGSCCRQSAAAAAAVAAAAAQGARVSQRVVGCRPPAASGAPARAGS